MDGMIVKSLTIDIENIKQDALKNSKKVKGLKRAVFLLGLAGVIGGIELYLQNKKISELENDIFDLQLRVSDKDDTSDDIYSSDID